MIGEASETSPEAMFRWGGRVGPMVPGFTFESMLPTHGDRACAFIRKYAAAEQPFFLYMSLNAPHSPVTPGKRWLGSSGLGQYADFVQEMVDRTRHHRANGRSSDERTRSNADGRL